MPVRLTCPNCKAVLALPSPAPAGTKVRCLFCQADFATPDDEVPLAEAVGDDEPRAPASPHATPATRRPAPARTSRERRDEGGANGRAAEPRRPRAGKSSGAGCLIGLLIGGVAALLLMILAGGIGVVLWYRMAPAQSGAPEPVLAQAPPAGAPPAAGGEAAPGEQARGKEIGKEGQAKGPAAPPRAAAAKTGDPEMDRLLFDLEAVDGAIRKAATDRLIAMKPNQHRAVVARKLAEQLPVVAPFDREPLIRALSVWATAAEVPALIQLLDSPEVHIRNVTLDALGKLRDERAVKPVVRCFKEFNTRWHSEQALKALGPMAEREVLALLEQPDRDLWVPAIYVLAEIGTEQSMPALREASKQFEMKGVAEGAMIAIQKRMRK